MKRIILSTILMMIFSILSFSQDLQAKVYKVVDEMPYISECEDLKSKEEKDQCSYVKMFTYIYSNLKYPSKAMNNGTQGTVEISFIVTSNGKIDSVKILKDIGNGCGESCKKTVEKMNKLKWIPGKQEGEKVNVEYTIPISFRLTGSQTKGRKR